jgi:5-oxoprolinase (ATP-hydrolysing)
VSESRDWQIWIDIGGTFTDALGLDPEGVLHRAKILSTGSLRGAVERREGAGRLRVRERWGAPRDFVRGFRFRLLDRPHPPAEIAGYEPESSLLTLADDRLEAIAPDTPFEVASAEDAPILAARLLTGTPPGRSLPAAALRLATTLATNALLERRGARTALFVTRGFGDLLRIGTQQRPDLFALRVRKPEPLHAAVVEVPERLSADGAVLQPLRPEALVAAADRLLLEGIDVAAVALLHAFKNPAHEQQLQSLLIERGFRHVSCSAELAPRIRLLPRAETALVDATLAPIIRDYLTRIQSSLGRGRLHVLTSAGGLVAPDAVRPKDTLLSGPAGGVVGAARAGRRSGFERLIAFDMGGTSTDVARFDRDYEYLFEHTVADAHLVAPALAIESVAAGGGSICRLDGPRLRVGPESAGASPGPACYGAGGPLTVTDVNLLLGRLDPERFEIPLNLRAASERLEELLARLHERTGERPKPGALLAGLLEIANERMADAIREVSLRRGYDPAAHALVAFGGAGGQHACAIAARLGMTTIVLPADAGLLSALGLGHAVVERFAEEQVLRPLQREAATVRSRFDRLARKAVSEVEREGIPAGAIEIRRRIAHLRFRGQDATVEVPFEEGIPLLTAFERRYLELFGHRPEGREVELESLRVVASSRAPAEAEPAGRARHFKARKLGCREVVLGGRATVNVPVFDRARLDPGARFEGPSLVFERHSAVVVEPGWCAEVDPAGALILRRARSGRTPRAHRRPEAVQLELFTNRLRSIAREMGERLQRTAISTNVRERLDFSCAVLDAAGSLLVNAPHIPVHLGALGLCVRRLREGIEMEPGDVVVTNHPEWGGSHLPDVTVVTPVYETQGGARRSGRGKRSALIGFVASRAHHAEIGGSRPGSFPPSATTLAEEGVVIHPTHLVRDGRGRWEGMRRILEGPPWPSRAVEDNLADLRAAAAANHAGALALRELVRERGFSSVRRHMIALQDLAETRVREALAAIPDGRYESEEHLDDGSPLRVVLTVEGDRAVFDFSGSAGVHAGNLNATPAVVQSVVIYVLRLLIRHPLPLNEGLLRPITLSIPHGILNPGFPGDPTEAPAVVAGNVETSQRLVDTLLKALSVTACSQGTMNNVLFGNERFGYYETIGGGCGAGPGFDGASAIHSHMTNTRLTDPEVIEHRYPVRIDAHAIRSGSGGAGRFRGGDGIVREISFLQPMTLSIVSQHRTSGPYGLRGGLPGRAGAQRLIRRSGEVRRLGPVDGCEVEAGDRLILETPGGGGYGRPDGSG